MFKKGDFSGMNRQVKFLGAVWVWLGLSAGLYAAKFGPESLDNANVGKASSSNVFFDKLLASPISDSNWRKLSNSMYVSPTGNVFYYNRESLKTVGSYEENSPQTFFDPDTGDLVFEKKLLRNDQGEPIGSSEKVDIQKDSEGNIIGYKIYEKDQNGNITRILTYANGVTTIETPGDVSAEVNQYTDKQIRTMDSKLVPALSNDKIATLKNGTFKLIEPYLTDEQIAGLPGKFLKFLSPEHWPHVSGEQLLTLTPAELKKIKINQWEQLGEGPIQILPQNAIGGLHWKVIQNIQDKLSNDQIHSLTGDALRGLSPTHMSELTPAQFGTVTGAVFNRFTADQLSVLNSNQVQGIPGAVIPEIHWKKIDVLQNSLSNAQIQSLLPGQTYKLSAQNFVKLSDEQLQAMTAKDLNKIAANTLGTLSKQQVGQINDEAMEALHWKRVASIQSNLTPAQIHTLNTQQVYGLNADSIKHLTNDQMEQLTKKEINKFSADVLAALTQRQVGSISNETLLSLNKNKINQITDRLSNAQKALLGI